MRLNDLLIGFRRMRITIFNRRTKLNIVETDSGDKPNVSSEFSFNLTYYVVPFWRNNYFCIIVRIRTCLELG